jgi:hypothetical protein
VVAGDPPIAVRALAGRETEKSRGEKRDGGASSEVRRFARFSHR